jgi:hypothetical protein
MVAVRKAAKPAKACRHGLGVHTSVAELEMAIELYIADHNARPKLFIWTASASDILVKVTRAKAALKAATNKY